jgi:TorA maturation chaperone TorD
MNAAADPADAVAAVEPEDQARANVYALLARLYADAPDRALLQAIASSDEIVAEGEQTAFARAWNDLIAASAAIDPEAAAQEYVDLFVGVGKSEVNLHASHYLTGFMMEKPLAALRARLARMGLEKSPGLPVVEDHIGALCETMRVLILGRGSYRAASVERQKEFFDAEIAPWFESLCNATDACSVSNYYRKVAELTRVFLRVELQAFQID